MIWSLSKWLNFLESEFFVFKFNFKKIYLNFPFSVSKESIIDIHAKAIGVESKIESCTEQNLELSVQEIFVISQAKNQLPLQIEDASRPEVSSQIYLFKIKK